MLPHDREEYRQQMGHVWLGFSEDQMRKMLTAAGFAGDPRAAAAGRPEAKGPALFAAVAHEDTWTARSTFTTVLDSEFITTVHLFEGDP